MSKKIYNKLVRDKIPEVIQADGKKPITRILDEKEYEDELIKKLKEEVEEFTAEPSIEELADIQEVIIGLRIAMSISVSELEDARRKKVDARGRFKKRIYLESVDE